MTDKAIFSNDGECGRYSTLRDWLAVWFRHLRLGLVCFCGILLGTSLFAWLWASRYYVSSMQFLVMPDWADAAVTQTRSAPGANNQAVTEEQVNSEMALLQGSDLLRQVVGACGLDGHAGITDVFLPAEPMSRALAKLDKATQRLAQALHVEAAKQADVINVSFGAVGPPTTPSCVLSELSNLYLARRLQLRRPPQLLEFFSQEADRYQQELATAEKQLADFGPSQGSAAPDIQRNLVTQKLVDAESALREAQQSIVEDRQRLLSLLDQIEATPSRIITQERDQSANSLLQQLESQLLNVKLKRTQLAMKFDADYPLVKEADKEVAETEATIANVKNMQLHDQTTDRDPTYEMLREDAAKTRADLSERTATVAALTQSIRYFQGETVRLDQTSVQFQDLLRDAKASEENYLLYLSKREEERSAEALDNRRIANVAVVVPPITPTMPAYSLFTVFGFGLLVALILSVLSVSVADYLDRSFRTPTDVADVLEIPILAAIPKEAA